MFGIPPAGEVAVEVVVVHIAGEAAVMFVAAVSWVADLLALVLPVVSPQTPRSLMPLTLLSAVQ